MIYHVLPGDSLVETFEKTDIKGEIIVCRECLIEGDLSAENLEDFWKVRENYLTKEFPKEENFYAENVRGEFEKLLAVSPFDEINLWFEYELFCQTNLWFCLSLLSEKDVEIYRVAPVVRTENDLWKGFGSLSANDLEKCFGQRIGLSKDDVRFGKSLWELFVSKDFQSSDFSETEDRESFPYLNEVCRAAAEIEIRPREKVREIIESGETDFGKVFQTFGKTEGVYGFGDAQVKKIYDSI
jgi:hypothetical protein